MKPLTDIARAYCRVRDTRPTTLRAMLTVALSWQRYCAEKNLEFYDLTQRTITDFIYWARPHLCDRTIRFRLERMRALSRWAVKEAEMPVDPFKDVEFPKFAIPEPQRQAFTYPEFQKVLREIERSRRKRGWFWWALAHVGWHTGLRISDAVHLRWDEVDLTRNGGMITVYPIKSRGRQRLTIPIEPDFWAVLVELREKAPLGNPYVNRDAQERYMVRGPEWFSSEFASICRSAGLPNHSFHCFRHGFVSRLINAGVDSVIVRAMSGHSLSVLASYAHVSDEAKSQALARSREAMHQVTALRMGLLPKPAVEPEEDPNAPKFPPLPIRELPPENRAIPPLKIDDVII